MKTVKMEHRTYHTETGASSVEFKVPDGARVELLGYQPGMEGRFDVVVISDSAHRGTKARA